MSDKSKLQPLREKVANLSPREKWLVLLTGFVLIIGVIDYFVVQPMRDERASIQIQIENLAVQRQNFDTQLIELTEQIANDPAMIAEREIEGLDKAIIENELRLRNFTDTLVAPQDMTEMLREILDSQKNLKLVELKNLPVAPILSDEETESNEDIGLFRHPVRLIFEGNYNDTLLYLAKLEAMENRFYWNRFDYQVMEYPVARVSLNTYTLSTQQWWIGDVEDED